MRAFPQSLELLLVAMIGVSAWLQVSGSFAQLFNITSTAPEGHKLASYLVVIVQMGNIAPILFLLVPNKFKRMDTSIALVLLWGIASLFFLSEMYGVQVSVSEDRLMSVGLFAGVFLAALGDALSNVVFWPFAGMCGKPYVRAMSVGEGFCGEVAALTVFAQSFLKFSTSAYFRVLATVNVVSVVAFGAFWYNARACGRYGGLKSMNMNNQASSASSESSYLDKQSKRRLTRSVFVRNFWLLAALVVQAMIQNGIGPGILPMMCRWYPGAYKVAQNSVLAASPLVALISACRIFLSKTSLLVFATFALLTVSGMGIVASGSLAKSLSVEQGTILCTGLGLCSAVCVAFMKAAAMYLLRSDASNFPAKAMTMGTGDGVVMIGKGESGVRSVTTPTARTTSLTGRATSPTGRAISPGSDMKSSSDMNEALDSSAQEARNTEMVRITMSVGGMAIQAGSLVGSIVICLVLNLK